MAPEIDHITIRPDRFGWLLTVKTEVGYYEFQVGDAIQFYAEVERTIGSWLADGPADFHNAADDEGPWSDEEERQTAADYDLMRDMERGK